jgi:hypothetical protein
VRTPSLKTAALGRRTGAPAPASGPARTAEVITAEGGRIYTLCYRAVELWTSFQQAGWVRKSVLAVLLISSVISWAVMVAVWRFRRSQRSSRRFMPIFRKARRLADVQFVPARKGATAR